MKCKKCKSKWKTGQRVSVSLAFCPFCGESFADNDDDDKAIAFDNSKDALIYIAQKHGSKVLLWKQLKLLFPGYAPLVSKNIMNLVSYVYESGAASALQRELNAEHADKEIAIKQAVVKLTEAYIAQELVTVVI